MFATGHRKYVAHGTVTESVGVCVFWIFLFHRWQLKIAIETIDSLTR